MIITGGGTGIGRATALGFAERGDRVLVVGRTAATLEESVARHENIRSFVADVTAPGAGERLVEAALRTFGRLDVLVNNAATGSFAPLAKLDRAAVERQLATDLVAPAFVAQAALDALEETGGTIVNVSTAASLTTQGFRDNAVYMAAKAGLNQFTRSWAVELAPRGIRVVSVAPGVTDTGIGQRVGMSDDQYQGFLEQISQRIPVGRVATPEEVAWWITTLAEPGGSYMTGAIVPVDGGLTLT
ncbi:short-chain dehydrogenase/reductase sdr [Streptomyces zinciresistens K42]|uniref:Short-chain dehydrogenase/reductase sdr n=1 Tax=Streptomyces zinciresistens K42 TaxID=700597 RepID=G2G7J7_9ACTN|nr:short-chain dehydrogenase/reductase sdr [Streptomyces zinciresistens K42]